MDADEVAAGDGEGVAGCECICIGGECDGEGVFLAASECFACVVESFDDAEVDVAMIVVGVPDAFDVVGRAADDNAVDIVFVESDGAPAIADGV